MDNFSLFDSLLHAESEDEVELVLQEAGFLEHNPDYWRPLGHRKNNFSMVGNQQTEASAALVEKLVNGIDAVLMSECFKLGLDPEGAKAPTSMAEAVQEFFKVRDGRLDNLVATQRTELAERIHLIAVGSKEAPCYLVVDKGEGQTPADFPMTFLSLGESNKTRIHFVQGKYNAGGTGVLQFCGKKNYQLIVSRRHPEAPSRPDDATRGLWGFTVVRRHRAAAGEKSSMYVYVAPGGQVPTFSADSIKVLAGESKKNSPAEAYSMGLTHGTCIKLYNYRWKKKSLATAEARYELERLLHSPCLPFRVTETRPYRANYYSTTVSGVAVAVASESGDEESQKLEPGFPAFGELNLESIGKLPYEIILFKGEVKPKHVPHGVFFTVNGQVHGQLPADYVTRHLKYDYLSGTILVSVNCTSMERSVQEDFFMASRDRIRQNEVYDEILEKLKDDLVHHEGLRMANAQRRKQDLESALMDEKEPTSFFRDLLKSDPALASLLSGGDRLTTSTGPGDPVPFIGKQFPSYFRIAKEPKTGLIKGCPVNRTCRVEFETDATNDYFNRATCPGQITIDPPNLCEHSHLWNGVFSTRFRVPWNAQPGDVFEVTVTVQDVRAETSERPFISRFKIKAEKEVEDVPSTSGPHGETHRKPQQNGKHFGPTLAPPTPHEVRKEAWKTRTPAFDEYTAIQVCNDGEGGYDFFINMDNTYLLTELLRAKDADKPLVRFWFKYGLMLCAVGMILDERRRGENGATPSGAEDGDERTSGLDLDAINRYCTGLSRIIIPMIRRLYRGPELQAEG